MPTLNCHWGQTHFEGLAVTLVRYYFTCWLVWIAGGWWLNPPTVFSPPNTLSLGVSYILYTYDLRHNFGPAPTVEKVSATPSQFYYNLNTAVDYIFRQCNNYGNFPQQIQKALTMLQAYSCNILKLFVISNTKNST